MDRDGGGGSCSGGVSRVGGFGTAVRPQTMATSRPPAYGAAAGVGGPTGCRLFAHGRRTISTGRRTVVFGPGVVVGRDPHHAGGHSGNVGRRTTAPSTVLASAVPLGVSGGAELVYRRGRRAGAHFPLRTTFGPTVHRVLAHAAGSSGRHISRRRADQLL